MRTLASLLLNLLICYPISLTFQTIIRYIFYKVTEAQVSKIGIDSLLLELAKVMKTLFSTLSTKQVRRLNIIIKNDVYQIFKAKKWVSVLR